MHFLNFATSVPGSNDELALGGYLSGYCLVVLRQRPMRWLPLLRLLVELLLEGLLAAILVACRVLVLAVDMVSWTIGAEVHRRPFIDVFFSIVSIVLLISCNLIVVLCFQSQLI